MRTVLVRQIKAVTEIPVVIARGDPAKFGLKKHAKELGIKAKPKLLKPKTSIPRKPVLTKSPPKKTKPGKLKWWNSLSQQEQRIYIKTHPKTTLKISKKARVKKAVESTKGGLPPADSEHAVKDTAPPVAQQPTGEKPKLSLHDIAAKIKKTVSSHDFANLFSNSGKLKAPLPDAPVNIRDTVDKSTKIQQKTADKGKPLPEPKDSEQATQQLFGHLTEESDNKIIQHVSKHLSTDDKNLLGQAMQFAAKNPEAKNPPHQFRKALKRTIIFALTAGVGMALLGPAGLLLVADGFNQFKNKTGQSLPGFAWRALRGKSLDEEGIQKEQDAEEERKHPEFDKTEAPIVQIIKNLKKQLKDIEDDKQRNPIKNLIEELGDRLDEYSDLEKDDDEEESPIHTTRHRRRK